MNHESRITNYGIRQDYGDSSVILDSYFVILRLKGAY